MRIVTLFFFNPLQWLHILHTVLYVLPCDADLIDMFDNPDNFISFRFKIISFILLTLVFDSGVYCEEKLGASNS